jgi:hypothetical protein
VKTPPSPVVAEKLKPAAAATTTVGGGTPPAAVVTVPVSVPASQPGRSDPSVASGQAQLKLRPTVA